MRSKLFRAVLYVLLLSAMFSTVSPSFAADTSSGTASSDASTAPAAATVSYKAAGSGSNGSGGDNYIFTGAATYAVPIAVPPGRLGMQPNLAIQYNSQKGNGLLGVGWDLTVASIQRNTTHGVSYAKDDFVFSSDGASGTLVSIGDGEYRMKTDDGSFMRFVYLGAASGWKAYDKSGMIYTFGSGDGGRQQDTLSKVFQWKLERAADTMGNSMEFFWFKDQGQIYLDRIEYTGNSTQHFYASNMVRFWYEPRTDAPQMHNTLFPVRTALRLKVVEVDVIDAGSWKPVRAYQLTYDPDTSTNSTPRSLLTSVQMFGSDVAITADLASHTGRVTGGSALPATTFDYQKLGKYEDNGLWLNGGGKADYAIFDNSTEKKRLYGAELIMDVNADGRNDVVFGPDYQGKFYFMEAGENGFIDRGNWVLASDGITYGASSYRGDFWKDSPGLLRVMDVNGDGHQDIVIGPDYYGHFFLLESTDRGFVDRGNWIAGGGSTPYGGHHYVNHPCLFHSMDVNGDGLQDIVIGPDENGSIFMLEATLTGFVNRGLVVATPYGGYWFDENPEQVRVMDVNGDGYFDLAVGPDDFGRFFLVAGTGKGFVDRGNWIFNPSSGLRDGTTSFGGHHYWVNPGIIRPMDVNGDGWQDIVIGPDDGGEFYLLGSTENGFIDRGRWIVDQNGVNDGNGSTIFHGDFWIKNRHLFHTMDMNSDGLQDIIVGPNYGGEFYLLEATANGFKYRDNWIVSGTTPYGGHHWVDNAGMIVQVDVTGDSLPDLLAWHGDGGGWYILKQQGEYPDLLSTARNGQGGTTVFEYTPSSHYANDYLPYVMPVVSAISIHDGFGNVSTTKYEYDSGYFDIKEREFRGFGYVKQTNPDRTTLETWFHQKDRYMKPANTDGTGLLHCEQNEPGCTFGKFSYHKGKPFVTVATDNTGHQMSQTDMVWEYVMPLDGQDPVYSRLKLKTTTSVIGGVKVGSQEIYTYDDTNKNGMVKSVEVSGTDAETVTTTNTYANFGYWTWRLTGTTITGSASGFARETTMEYYPATDAKAGKLRKRSFRLDGAAVNPGVSYEYDAFGNVVKEYDANNNMTERVYDTATQTLPEEVRYPQTGTVTHVVKQQFDPVFRIPKYSWEENGVRTVNWFDRFGRVKRTETFSDTDWQTIAETQMQYVNAVVAASADGIALITTPAYVYKSVLNDIEDIPCDGQMRYYISGWEYFDGLGRRVQTVSRGENSKLVASNTLYDEMGRVKYTQGPQFVSSPAYRQVDELLFSSTIPFKSWFYNNNGSLSGTSSPHETGVLALDYIFYYGLSTTVTDADGRKKATKRDYLGRIIEVKESSDANTTITTTYKYNAVGDLTNITNGANVTEITYDSLGRKISMSDPDMGYWMYCYDASGNMLRQLDPKRQMIEFAYDPLNRVTTKKYFTVADNVNVKVGVATESTDLCSRTLPIIANTAEYPVTWAYDNPAIRNGKGRLFSVTSGTSSTTYDSYDAAGRVAQVSARIDGNYYTTQYSYDYIGRLRGVQYPGGENFAAYYYYHPGSTLLKSVVGSDNVTYASFSGYNAAGSPGLIAYGNGLATSYGYKPATFNLASITTVQSPADCSAPTVILSKTYGFSPANDINTLGTQAGANYTYTYDGLHRLTGEQSGVSSTGARLPQDSLFIYASPSHRLERIETGGSVYPFQYDKNGNMEIGHEAVASPVKRIITWNADNMPKSITHGGQTTAFFYDGSATRVKKTGPLGTTYYIGKHFEIVNGVKTRHIFAGGMRIAQISGGTRYYHHKDHLGSTIGVTNDAGTLVWKADYEPYGLQRGDEQTGMDSLIRHRFTDQEYDAETRLYNYNARLYDPTIARFISPDTIVDNPYSSLALNRYMYVAGNPLRYTDPSGHVTFKQLFGKVNTNQVIGVVEVAAGVYTIAEAPMWAKGLGLPLVADGMDRILNDGGIGSKKGTSGTVRGSVDISFGGPNNQSAPENHGNQQGSGSGNNGNYSGTNNYMSEEMYLWLLATGKLDLDYTLGGRIEFGYGTSLYAFDDMNTTWVNMGMGALNGRGGMNYVARESDKLDIDSRMAVKALIVTGGAVGAAALAPEAYLIFLTHPAWQSRFADFVSGYAPGPPPLTLHGIGGFIFSTTEDYVRKQ